MKLNIFLVLLALLLLSCLGSNIQEGFGIGRDIENLGDDVGRGIGNLGKGAGNIVGGVGRGIGGIVGGVGNVAGGIVGGVGNVAGGIARGVGDVAGGIGDGVGDVVGGVERGIGNVLGTNYVGDDYYAGGAGSYGDPYPIEEIEERQRPSHNRDKWILKSQIVPPVCPKCPDIRTCRQTPCPACPPCGRCPEPAFTCEKVPNYSSRNNNMPRPVLGDFSTFGM